jgi:hypothetical protein
MDDSHFDNLARDVGRIASRRRALQVLAAGTVRGGLGLISRGGAAALTLAVGQTVASAKKRKRCRRPCEPCQRCKRGRCQPGPNDLPCPDDGNPCTIDVCAAGQCTHPVKANGTPCAGGQQCVDGQCGCPEGAQLCGERCASLLSDARNCGSCGSRCALNEVCRSGRCECVNGSCSLPGATCCAAGSGSACVCGGGGFVGDPTTCRFAGACPPGSTGCGSSFTCLVCCPSNTTCDPTTFKCIPQ